MSEFAPTPLHGAAYKVLLERCDIANCSNAAAHAKIRETLEEIRKWSLDQEKPIFDAYAWAITRITADADARLAVCNNSVRVFAAYDLIPKPPAA